MHYFEFYLRIGFQHIADLAAYDHILFLIVLCAIYKLEQWRNVLILITAFTLGHSLTLILVSLDAFSVSSRIVKFLIPMTILITSIHNVISTENERFSKIKRNYAIALLFGMIHGMDFSNYFRALIMDNSEIIIPLFGFNVGIELGQILIVGIIVFVAYLFLRILGIKHREWNLFVSGSAFGISLISIIELFN